MTPPTPQRCLMDAIPIDDESARQLVLAICELTGKRVQDLTLMEFAEALGAAIQRMRDA